ncbi:hypothetical protein BGZ51_000018 [Haplosporangium sp. Z 767]|nr:hypothetical protein BGZ51_000018 [Haplosporangium sp. Z 767]
MFVWLLLGCILGVLSQFLLQSESFPFFLFYPSVDAETDASIDDRLGLTSISNSEFTTLTPAIEARPGAPSSARSLSTDATVTSPTTLSGLTAMILMETTTRSVPYRVQYVAPAQICIIVAHLSDILWLGTSLALMQWSWYLYRCLSRKLGIVNPRLMDVITANNPTTSRSQDNVVESQFTAGFSFERPFRSLADLWFNIPVFIITPFALLGLMIQTGFKQCFCFCRTSDDVPDIEGQGDDLVSWISRANAIQEQSSTSSAVSDTGVGSSSSAAGFSIASEHHPASSLATKFHVSRVDLIENQEESYSYDIRGRRIRYRKDSWVHKLKRRATGHKKILEDVFVCIGLPTIMFIVLFSVSARGRSYEVYPKRGGCRVSRTSGRDDWISILVLEALITGVALSGLFFAATLHFRKQNGSFSFKIESLTPSPEVLRLYKSTRVIKHFLLMCLCLNIVLCLARVTHLGLFGFVFKTIHPPPPTANGVSPPNWEASLDSNRTLTMPLFELAYQDHDICDIAVLVLLVIISFLFLLWSRLQVWAKSIKSCCFSSQGEELDDDDEVNPFPFPFNSGMTAEQRDALARKNQVNASESSFGRGTTLLDMERKDGTKRPKSVAFDDREEDIAIRRRDIEEGFAPSVSINEARDTNRRGLKISMTDGSLLSNHRVSCGLRESADSKFRHIQLQAIKSSSVSNLSKGAIAIPVTAATLNVGRNRHSSTWVPSPPVHGHYLPKTPHSGKMMGQYLQLSRQTVAAQNNVGISPFSAASIPITGCPPGSFPDSRIAVADGIRQTNEKTLVTDNKDPANDSKFFKQVMQPTSPGGPEMFKAETTFPTNSAFSFNSRQTRSGIPSSGSITSSQHSGKYMGPHGNSCPGYESSCAPSSHNRKDHPHSESKSRISSRKYIETSKREVDDESDRVLDGYSSNRKQKKVGTSTLYIQYGPDRDHGDLASNLESAFGYNQVLRKLAKKKQNSTSSKDKVTAVYPVSRTRHGDICDNDISIEEDDSTCGIETMGAISLEDLMYSDPSVELSHQKILPADSREIHEIVIHHTLNPSDYPPIPVKPSSHRGGATRQHSVRRPRRPSMIRYATLSSTSKNTRSSRGYQPSSSCSHLVPKNEYQAQPQPGLDADDDEGFSKCPLMASDKSKIVPARKASRSTRKHGHRREEQRIYISKKHRRGPRSSRLKGTSTVDVSLVTNCDPARPDSPLLCPRSPFFPIRSSSRSVDISPAAQYDNSTHVDGDKEAVIKIYSPSLDCMIALPKGSRPPSKDLSSTLNQLATATRMGQDPGITIRSSQLLVPSIPSDFTPESIQSVRAHNRTSALFNPPISPPLSSQLILKNRPRNRVVNPITRTPMPPAPRAAPPTPPDSPMSRYS